MPCVPYASRRGLWPCANELPDLFATVNADKSLCAGKPDIALQQPCAHARSAQLYHAIRSKMSIVTTSHLLLSPTACNHQEALMQVVDASGVRPHQLVANAQHQVVRPHHRSQFLGSCLRSRGSAGSSAGADPPASRLRRCGCSQDGGCPGDRRPSADPCNAA